MTYYIYKSSHVDCLFYSEIHCLNSARRHLMIITPDFCSGNTFFHYFIKPAYFHLIMMAMLCLHWVESKGKTLTARKKTHLQNVFSSPEMLWTVGTDTNTVRIRTFIQISHTVPNIKTKNTNSVTLQWFTLLTCEGFREIFKGLVGFQIFIWPKRTMGVFLCLSQHLASVFVSFLHKYNKHRQTSFIKPCYI